MQNVLLMDIKIVINKTKDILSKLSRIMDNESKMIIDSILLKDEISDVDYIMIMKNIEKIENSSKENPDIFTDFEKDTIHDAKIWMEEYGKYDMDSFF